MMSLLRIILWALIFYLIIRTARNVLRLFTSSINKIPKEKVQQPPSKYKIDKDDVIDAHFEDLDSTKSNKPKDNA